MEYEDDLVKFSIIPPKEEAMLSKTNRFVGMYIDLEIDSSTKTEVGNVICCFMSLGDYFSTLYNDLKHRNYIFSSKSEIIYTGEYLSEDIHHYIEYISRFIQKQINLYKLNLASSPMNSTLLTKHFGISIEAVSFPSPDLPFYMEWGVCGYSLGRDFQIQFQHAHEGNHTSFSLEKKITAIEGYQPNDNIFWELYVCFQVIPLGKASFEPFELYITYTTIKNFELKQQMYLRQVENNFVRVIPACFIPHYDFSFIQESLGYFEHVLDGTNAQTLKARADVNF